MFSATILASIPSPSRGVLHLGPLPLRAYALCILGGVFAAVALAGKRWVARGGDERTIGDLAVWAVPAGLVGARLYHVVTDYQLYTDDPLGALKVWEGGLGIWGGVALGAGVGLWVAHRRHLDLAVLLDVVAPAIPLAQAIGRWGNWFNQELFGRPTSLPWGLRIDVANRPDAYAQSATFHPTFLYESLWCLVVVAIVLAVERRRVLRPGRLFALYVAAYTFGRFWFELLRIDSAHRIGGLRINDWVSVVVFVAAMAVVVTGRRRPSSLGVPSIDEHDAHHEGDGGVGAEHGEARPRRQGRGAPSDDLEDGSAGLAREVPGDVVVPGGRQKVHQDGQDEEQADQGGDRARGTAEDHGESDAHQPDRSQVQGASHHGAQDAGVAERHAGVLGREDRLPDTEGTDARDQADDHDHRREDQRLGREHQAPLGDGAEGGPDLAGGVLGAHDQHAQHSEGELGQEDPVQAETGRVEAEALAGVDAVPATDAGGTEEGAQADDDGVGHEK